MVKYYCTVDETLWDSRPDDGTCPNCGEDTIEPVKLVQLPDDDDPSAVQVETTGIDDGSPDGSNWTAHAVVWRRELVEEDQLDETVFEDEQTEHDDLDETPTVHDRIDELADQYDDLSSSLREVKRQFAFDLSAIEDRLDDLEAEEGRTDIDPADPHPFSTDYCGDCGTELIEANASRNPVGQWTCEGCGTRLKPRE